MRKWLLVLEVVSDDDGGEEPWPALGWSAPERWNVEGDTTFPDWVYVEEVRTVRSAS